MVPVILRARGLAVPVPPVPIHYAVTADGVFEVRDTELYRSETKSLAKLPGLERGVETLEIRMPRLPATLMRDAVAFFAEVNRLCGSEGVLILFYDPATRSYRAEAPPQVVRANALHGGRFHTSLAVKYGVAARPEGYLRCGSIHSHADLAAYASSTDCDDELEEDGLHVVVGDFGRVALSMSAAFTAAGRRFAVALDDAIEPFDAAAACTARAPDAWIGASTIEFVAGGGDRSAPRRVLPLATVAALLRESAGTAGARVLAARRSSEPYDVTAFAPLAAPAATAPPAPDDANRGRAANVPTAARHLHREGQR